MQVRETCRQPTNIYVRLVPLVNVLISWPYLPRRGHIMLCIQSPWCESALFLFLQTLDYNVMFGSIYLLPPCKNFNPSINYNFDLITVFIVLLSYDPDFSVLQGYQKRILQINVFYLTFCIHIVRLRFTLVSRVIKICCADNYSRQVHWWKSQI